MNSDNSMKESLYDYYVTKFEFGIKITSHTIHLPPIHQQYKLNVSDI